MDVKSSLKIVGSCDWVRDCDCCGKSNLRKTFVMENEGGEYFFYGSDCAVKNSREFAQAKKAKTPISKIDKVLKVKINGYDYRLIYMSGCVQYVDLWNPSKEQWQRGLVNQLKLEIYESGQYQELLKDL